MKNQVKWVRIIYIIGVIALIIGALDPLEGSLVIDTGAVFIVLSSFLMQDRHRKVFLISAIMIFVGVFSLWLVSSLGGYDPKREWWWNVLIIPYPLGWVIFIVTLVLRAMEQFKQKHPKIN